MPTQDFKGTVNGEVPPLRANVIKGDGTEGRVLRCMTVRIKNGATAAHIKVETTSVWNGDVIAESTEFTKGETSAESRFILDASGYLLSVLNAGITGDPLAVLSATISYNASGTILSVFGAISSTHVRLLFYNNPTGETVDLTTLVDTGEINVTILYVTSA